MYTLKSDRKNHLVVTEDVRKELVSFSRRCQCCIVRLQIFLGHICRIETLEDKNMHISVNQREGRLFNLGVTTALNVLLFGFTRILSIKWDTEKKNCEMVSGDASVTQWTNCHFRSTCNLGSFTRCSWSLLPRLSFPWRLLMYIYAV